MTGRQWGEAARIRLEAATVLVEEGFPSDAVTRTYYAVFSAAKALLRSQGLKAKTHRGTNTLLHKHFRDAVDAELFRSLQEEREDCDYRLLKPSESKARRRIRQARSFVETVEDIRGSDENGSGSAE